MPGDMWDALIGAATVILAAIGLFAGWLKSRESALRREDVLAWANEVVGTLESLLLVCLLKNPPLDPKTAKAKLETAIFDTAVLVERGRLFFKNEVIDDWGADKPPAYRGYRPKILDPIVVAHQIACQWSAADNEKRLRMRIVAEDALKAFVTLAQKEVGRSRTVASENRKGGSGAHLRRLLDGVDPERLDKVRRREGW